MYLSESWSRNTAWLDRPVGDYKEPTRPTYEEFIEKMRGDELDRLRKEEAELRRLDDDYEDVRTSFLEWED